jgi:predicted site-specific integrase-resolvase
MRAKAAAKQLGISYCHFLRILASGVIPHYRLSEGKNSHIIIDDQGFESWLSSRKAVNRMKTDPNYQRLNFQNTVKRVTAKMKGSQK